MLKGRVVMSSAGLSVASFGSEAFLKVIHDHAPVDLLCHHAADVTNYKSPEFDPLRALENNTANLLDVLSTFKDCGGKAVLLTGTVFEMDEGKGEEALHPFSPYGLSKGLTWQIFRYFCQSASVPLGKFVIPNPFGPWEEPRFTGYLMKTWKEGKTAKVQTPDYVRDNIHVDLLASAYAAFAGKVAGHTGGAIKLNPSGYIETQGVFAQRVSREVQARTKWLCGLDILVQTEFPEPRIRTNLQPATELVPAWTEPDAWDAFVDFYNSP
jgi:nucleoside-diphosphate-sugar epimerase